MSKHTSHKCENLTGTITVPGDKSISHRALILSSQILGTTKVTGLLGGEDVIATANALRSMGVYIVQRSDYWLVKGVGVGGLGEPDNVLDCGNSGTSARLLMGLVAPYPFTSFFTGDASLRKRPMKRVTTPLAQFGVEFCGNNNMTLPLGLMGRADTRPIHYELPVASAQVKSAIILAALNTAGKTTVVEPVATRDHTEKMLTYFGFKLEIDGNSISIQGQQPQTYQDHEFAVPTDPSSAAFPAVAALITKGSKLSISNVSTNPHRTGLYTTLKEMGADISFTNEREVAGEPVADIHVSYSQLNGVEVPAARAPSMIDEYPILAVAAAFASGKTTMRGLGELRVKESNRFAAIEQGLKACGVNVEVDGDDITIHGAKIVNGGAHITTNLDHRICMSFLVMGMATEKPISIDSAEPINTSFPGFIDLCNGLGSSIKSESDGASPLVIAIDGQAASGKGTLARRLAKHYGLQYLDTGTLYRAVGKKLLDAGLEPENKAEAAKAAKNISIDDLSSPGLRNENVGSAASIVSAYPEVRAALLEFQREVARSPKGAVLDGRDIGTVVCPDARVKIFLTASMEARTKRRHKQLSDQGVEVVYQSVYDDLKERDERDAARDIAPMKPADDALVIDSSTMDANSVMEKAKSIVDKNRI